MAKATREFELRMQGMQQRGCWNIGRIIDMGDMTKTSVK